MERYIVKTITTFDDYGGKEISLENEKIRREIGDIFRCCKERYIYLKSLKLVYLVGIDKFQHNK